MHKFKSLSLVCLLAIAAFFAGCDDKEKQVTFDSKGGSAVQSQTVKEGEKAKEPEKPTKAVFAGLYAGTFSDAGVLPDAYSFCGWYYGDAKWDFDIPITQDIVLTAKWSGEELTRIEAVPANDVAKTIAYIIANPAEYTMFVDKDVNVAPQLIDISNVELTIIGLGGIERKIRLSSNGSLFHDMDTHIANCAGKQIVRAAARYNLKDIDIAKITLGNFLTESATRPISEIYKIEDSGVNIGKLVAKDLSMKK